jgi:hypothetical protein
MRNFVIQAGPSEHRQAHNKESLWREQQLVPPSTNLDFTEDKLWGYDFLEPFVLLHTLTIFFLRWFPFTRLFLEKLITYNYTM